MSTPQRGLGRGLDALFKGGGRTDTIHNLQKLPITVLAPNPQQPRRHFAEQQLEELAASIKAQGILQPLLVRPAPGSTPQKYEIVAGERRWRASALAGLQEVPVVVRELSDQEALLIALVENLQREDLNPLEEAQGMQQLREEFGLSQEDLAQRLGKSRSSVANALRLLTLPESARLDLLQGRLTAGHARALLTVSNTTMQDRLRSRIVRERLTVREAEVLAGVWKESGEIPAGEHVARSSKEKEGSGNAVQHPALSLFQEQLSRHLAHPVSIKGTEQKGRISLGYRSAEDLQDLLEKLGLRGAANDV